MTFLRIQRWWSLRPFIARGVDHFCGSTRDERHFEFRQCYWSHRLAGCGHKGSLMLARMELRMLVERRRIRREVCKAVEGVRRILDEDPISQVMDEIEARRG